MNKLSATQRDQLIGLGLGTAAFVALAWYVLVLPLRASLDSKEQKLTEVRGQVEVARRNLQLLDQFEGDLKASRAKLQQREDQMASGDVYRWILRTFDELEATHAIRVFNLEAPRLEPSRIPPEVPYKAAVFSVSGTAHYHEFGTFLADLENKFPLMRLQELELRPARFVDTSSDDREKLAFKMELLTFVRSIPPKE